MWRASHFWTVAIRRMAGVAMVIAVGSVGAIANDVESISRNPSVVSFDLPDLPPATVEIDLGQGLIRHAMGMGDAAIAGFLEGLMTSPEGDSSENAQFVAQQLTSARELGDIASEVVHEIHVRVWDNLPKDSQLAEDVVRHFDGQLKGRGWESTVRVRDGNGTVRVFVHQDGESLGGVLIVAGEGNDLVVANIIGDLSPEKVHRLTAAATKIGVKLGLDKEINKAVDELRREMQRH